jgi:serine phosphatase RsbU (regulator of sigma subunit)
MLQKTTIDQENNIVYAQTIQNGLLPKTRHFHKFFKDHFILYSPQDKISGDFYWISSKGDNLYFALADCTGHGVSGAMLSVLGISLLNYVIQKNYDHVGDYLTELDKKWIETFNNELHDSQYNNDWLEITIISFNLRTRAFQYACGGGEFAIHQNNSVEIYKGNKFPIGGWQLEKNRIFDTHHLTLAEDAKLYFFSDGIKHQFDSENQKKFGRKKLLELIQYCHQEKMENQGDFFDFIIQSWKGNEKQTDDISLIAFEF